METSTYLAANAITLALDIVVVVVGWRLAASTAEGLVLMMAPLVWGPRA